MYDSNTADIEAIKKYLISLQDQAREINNTIKIYREYLEYKKK